MYIQEIPEFQQHRQEQRGSEQGTCAGSSHSDHTGMVVTSLSPTKQNSR